MQGLGWIARKVPLPPLDKTKIDLEKVLSMEKFLELMGNTP